MLNKKWFEKDGSVFVVDTKTKKSQDFRLGNNFQVHEVVAFNVGHSVAKHMVQLHNASLE